MAIQSVLVNGNEVWLIAAAAVLFLAFPRAYAAGFSGFYLALIIVLWLFMFRGLALELRSHLDHPLWRQLCDVVFSGASLLLAIVFGAALGNLIRGVPLSADGYFIRRALDGFYQPVRSPEFWIGIACSLGLASAAILALHGANYLAMKTDGGPLCAGRWLWQNHDRLAGGWQRGAGQAWGHLHTAQFSGRTIPAHPVGYFFPVGGAIALVVTLVFRRRQRDVAAFMASSLFILAMLGSLAWGCYPNILIATTDPENSLTIYNAATDTYGLQVGPNGLS